MTGFSIPTIRTGPVRRMRVDAGEELALAKRLPRTDRWTGRALPEVAAEETAGRSAKVWADAAEAASRFNINAGR